MGTLIRLNALLALVGLALAGCQSTTYQDKLPPADYFDPDDSVVNDCTPLTCDALGVGCGRTEDGCGGTQLCGGCPDPQTCGGAGTPGECGCVPLRSCRSGVDCGSIADGCGGTPDCGDCPAGQTCGAGGQADVCGVGSCTPESDADFCARLNKACGALSAKDNCGKAREVASCGSCGAPDTCSALGTCSCVSETDSAFCARLGSDCGTLSSADNCGQARSAKCGEKSCGTYASGSGSHNPGTPDTGWTPWKPPAEDAGSTSPGTDASAPQPGADAGAVSSADAGSTDCPEANRLCAHAFTYQGNGSEKAVAVHGTFDSWGAGAAMTDGAGNLWSASVPVPWNTQVLYKLVVDGNWIVDPANPNTSGTGVYENSVLAPLTCTDWTCAGGTGCTATSCSGSTPTCNATSGQCECTTTSCGTGMVCSAGACQASGSGPQLVLVAAPTVGATSYSFQVQFVPGGAELDTTKTVIALNGAPITSVAYDAGTHLFSVSATGVAASKYAYLFRVQDLNGKGATLFVPFWVEAATWSWQDAIMYEIMTDRFLDGDPSNDAPIGSPVDHSGDWQGGDFAGITQKINANYFDQMGINTLWISSPVLGASLYVEGSGANAGHYLSAYHAYFPLATGWSYDTQLSGITNPIEPHFGTADELKALVNAAHAHGIRVLTDLVVNHVFGDSNPPNGQPQQLAPLWAAHQSDTAWFNTPYNASVNDCGNENLWDTDTSQTWNRTNCWFDPYLPDFNTSNPTVNDTLAEHAVWLLEEFNLDGFRVDATKQVANNVCSDLRAHINSAVSTGLPFYMVGEALGGNVSFVMDCVGSDKLNGSVDDNLHYSMVNSFLNCSEPLDHFDSDVSQDEYTWTHVYPNAIMGHFFGSHDVPRAISLANGDDTSNPWSNQPGNPGTNAARAFGRLRLAQAFLFTYDSIPILWMGDEYGLPGAVDPDNRRMMLFDSALSSDQKSALAFFQKVGTARNTHSALRRGTRQTLVVDGNFYAYARIDGANVAIVVLNRNESTVARSVPLNGLAVSGTLSDALGGAPASVSSGSLSVSLGSLSAAIYTN